MRLLCLVCVSVCLLNPVLSSSIACSGTRVDCLCESNYDQEILSIEVETKVHFDEHTGLATCVVKADPLEVCESRGCVIIPNNNFDHLFKGGHSASISNSIEDYEHDEELFFYAHNTGNSSNAATDKKKSYLPVQLKYIRRNETETTKNLRVRRSRRACAVPQLENAEVVCWKWPNFQTCKQECIHGYGVGGNGMKTVRNLVLTCRNSENKWKPRPFIDCQPYLNCKVHLKSPGDLKCTESGKEPAFCDIDCGEYEDMPAKKERFVCESANSRLPHCAYFDEDMHLLDHPSD